MKKSVKALSVILILAALFGLAGGGYALKDVMECKSYWEAKGEESDANLSMLEDGLNTLQENEAAYVDGKDAYEQGLKDYEAGKEELEAGKAEYEAGLKTLEEKQAEYDAGLATLNAKQAEYDAGLAQLKEAEQKLAAGQKQYDEGAATLAQAGALLQGLADINSGFANWQAGYKGLLSFQQSAAAQGTALPAPAADNIATYDGAIAQTKTSLETGIGYYDQLADLEAKKAQLETAIAAMTEAGANTTELEAQLAQVNIGITQIEAGLDGKPSRDEMVAQHAMVEQLVGVPQAVADGQKTLSSGVATAVNGILANEEMAAKLVGASGMSAEQLAGTVAALPTMDYATFNDTMAQLTQLANGLVGGENGLQAQYTAGSAQLAESKKVLDAGYAEYNAGKAKLDDGAAQLAAGRAQLADGKVQLEEGKKTLEAAEKTIAQGEKALADAEKQLTEGKAKLDEFEAGRDQVMDGLDTLLATETYAGLVSIADRLGSDYTYMKNDTDLDIGKGLEAVAAAREFSSENSAAVTKELTTRAVAAVLALLGSAVALIAGIMGLAAKVKGSGVLAVIAAVAAAAAVVAAFAAGSELSAVAGSTVASLALAAGAVVAVVAVVHAAVALSPAKAPAAE